LLKAFTAQISCRHDGLLEIHLKITLLLLQESYVSVI